MKINNKNTDKSFLEKVCKTCFHFQKKTNLKSSQKTAPTRDIYLSSKKLSRF